MTPEMLFAAQVAPRKNVVLDVKYFAVPNSAHNRVAGVGHLSYDL